MATAGLTHLVVPEESPGVGVGWAEERACPSLVSSGSQEASGATSLFPPVALSPASSSKEETLLWRLLLPPSTPETSKRPQSDRTPGLQPISAGWLLTQDGPSRGLPWHSLYWYLEGQSALPVA